MLEWIIFIFSAQSENDTKKIMWKSKAAKQKKGWNCYDHSYAKAPTWDSYVSKSSGLNSLKYSADPRPSITHPHTTQASGESETWSAYYGSHNGNQMEYHLISHSWTRFLEVLYEV